ncbi:hypothetical protein ABQE93_24345 [Mycolicibacterium sp. XJ662]
MTDFPILDAARDYANREFGRFVLEGFGYLDAYIDEIDNYCSMGLRLVHDQAAGIHLELGPYDLDRNDVERLRAAIRAYDLATRGQAAQ